MCVFINFIHTILICTVYRHEANTNFRLDVINYLTALKNINIYIYIFLQSMLYVLAIYHILQSIICVFQDKSIVRTFLLFRNIK